MAIRIIAVGKMKEKPYREMADEYLKRLSRYGKFEEIQLPDLPETNLSPAEEEIVKQKEGNSILQEIKQYDYVIAMTIEGKMRDSVDLSNHISALFNQGKSDIVFVIGGSLGLSKEVTDRANEQLSMSKMTFPHQLARVMLMEQLYRAMKIRAGEKYHK